MFQTSNALLMLNINIHSKVICSHRILLKHKSKCEILNIIFSSGKTFNFVIQCLLTIYWLSVNCWYA